MKTTFLLLSLGFLGYTLYNKFYKTGSLASAMGGTGESQSFNESGNSSGIRRSSQSGGMNFDTGIEAQIERGEGLTDEAKVGIND